MKASDIPGKISLPFGAGAGGTYIRTVPVASQIGIQDGAASYTDGFPPLNFYPVASGGVPPFGQDMNGLLNAISALSRWYATGAPVPFDATFSTAIGGYPKGAVVQSASSVGLFWLCLADDNTTDPDAGGANWTPAFPRGAVSGFASFSASAALTASQLGNLIQIAGATAAGQTFTLCALASVPNAQSGMGYWILNLSANAQTIKGNATEIFQPSGLNSFTLQPNEAVFISNQGTTQWNVFGSIAAFNFPSSQAASGYQKLTTGLILQWGRYDTLIPVNDGVTITLPITFPNNAFVAIATPIVSRGTEGGQSAGAQAISKSQITISNTSSAVVTEGISWWAIGN